MRNYVLSVQQIGSKGCHKKWKLTVPCCNDIYYVQIWLQRRKVDIRLHPAGKLLYIHRPLALKICNGLLQFEDLFIVKFDES